MAEKIRGVYSITCQAGGKKRIYIGSSKDVHRRWSAHLSSLRRDVHKNPRLQNCWNKYGEDSFEFSIIEVVCVEFGVVSREAFWVRELAPDLNINVPDERMDFFVPSAETRLALSMANTGKKLTDEHRAKIARSNKGRKLSPERIEFLCKSNFGRTHSDEWKIMMSLLHTGNKYCKGNILSAETRTRISKSLAGKPKTDEHKRKLSESASNRKPISDEARAKMVSSHTGKKMSQDTIAKREATKLANKLAGNGRKSPCPFSDEHLKNLSKSKIGNTNTLGYKRSPESIAKQAATRAANKLPKSEATN